MKKIALLIIALLASIICYYIYDFSKFVFFKDVKLHEEFVVYKTNSCQKEINDNYLCRIDLIGDRHLVSVGLPERYVKYLGKQKILISTYNEKNRLCLKEIRVGAFSEKFISCTLVYIKLRNDR